mmetsp:Transcript_43081/g.87112  ORF Transcript_43081/g.87112 Transcript_43081/m.87112 type:complete len:123 (-) Transcript_43081:203-571(-)
MDVIDIVSSALLEDVSFNEELEEWCKERCTVFTEELEHKLEYTALHQEFCLLFEKRITDILEGGGHSIDVFWQKLTKAADGDESMFSESFLLQCLAAIVDYDQFVVTMRGLKESAQQAASRK